MVHSELDAIAMILLAWHWTGPGKGGGDASEDLLAMTIIIICCKTQVNWSGRKMMAQEWAQPGLLPMKNDVETGPLQYCPRIKLMYIKNVMNDEKFSLNVFRFRKV